MRCLSLLILLALLGSPLSAQAPDTTLRAYPAQSGMASRLVGAQYDSQYDKTVLRLGPVALDSTLSMSALVALDGRVVTKAADGVVLTFWSTAADRPLATNRAVVLSLGATDFDLGAAWLTPQPRPGYIEVCMKSLSLGLWLAFASSEMASVRVGGRTFPVTAEIREAVRDFASRMAPAGSAK